MNIAVWMRSIVQCPVVVLGYTQWCGSKNIIFLADSGFASGSVNSGSKSSMIVYFKSLSDSNWLENDYNGACFE